MWSDADGSLTRGELWRLVRDRRRQLAPGPLVVCSENQRGVVIDVLAGLLARRTVRVVSPRSGARARRAAATLGAGPPGVFFATSGTSGTSRVAHTRRSPAVLAQLLGPIGVLPSMRRPVVASLASVSHGHGFGAFAATLILGGHFIAVEPGDRTPVETVGRIDLLTGVPLQLREFAQRSANRGLSIRAVLSGSDRLSPADARLIESRLSPELYNAYGATESGIIAVATPSQRRRYPETVGAPMPGVRVSDDDGRLVVRSAMLGGADFRGDAGHLDNGLIHLRGRADGLRVSGGENVHADAVLEWVRQRSDVVEARGATRADARFGSRFALQLVARRPVDVGSLRESIRTEFGEAATPADITVSLRPE